jgi:glutamate formiminotransferase/formiminotetrahydrofolate cyclodeaminase
VDAFDDYLDALASAQPTPGGGSAAAVVAMTAAALVAMVARVTAAAPRRSDAHAEARSIASEADALRDRLGAARVRDESAYGAVAAAMKLPKSNEAERVARTAALQSALGGAAAAPLEIASLAQSVALLARRALVLGNENLASDLGCAAEFAVAAARGAAYNVRVNHLYMKDAALIQEQSAGLGAAERAAEEAAAAVRAAVGPLLVR